MKKQKSETDLPPFVKTWNQFYWMLFIWLLLLIALFYAFTVHFS